MMVVGKDDVEKGDACRTGRPRRAAPPAGEEPRTSRSASACVRSAERKRKERTTPGFRIRNLVALKLRGAKQGILESVQLQDSEFGILESERYEMPCSVTWSRPGSFSFLATQTLRTHADREEEREDR